MKASIGLLALAMIAPACADLKPRAPSVPTAAAATETVRLAFAGEGSLEALGERTGKTRLALARLDVSAETSGDDAETTVEHVFRNDTDERLEGTFRFPLPADAIVTGLALEVNGEMVDGQLVEREKARKAYEQVVDQMRDPALLEWESGGTFKLRVFPIEPRRTKRVRLRFVAPLHRSAAGLFFVARPPSPDSGLDAERFVLRLDGRRMTVDEATPGANGELLFKVADAVPEVVSEATADGTYMHVHLRPEGLAAGDRKAGGPKAMILLCDRSRSMLEARTLQTKVASTMLSDLGPADRFTVLLGDIRPRAMPGGLRRGDRDDEVAALAWLDADEPDGASDLGQLLVAGGAVASEARASGLEPVVVYLGDAAPTWGETRAVELGHVAAGALGASPLHMVLLGKSTDDATARALVEAAHGRLLRPKTEVDARVAAEKLKAAAIAPRIDDVRLSGIDGADVPLPPPATIYEGDDVDFSLFVPKGTRLPSPTLAGVVAGKPFARPIPFSSALPGRDVAKRWATSKIELLDRDGVANKDQVIAVSLAHGVMSRFTSLLVLESEQAYEQMQIPRNARQADPADVHVGARDIDGSSATVTPDHLQPGDPEVRVQAPADAQSVVVVFPFGETKTAAFEPGEGGGAWIARFLVDRHTPDGTYEILVRVTLRDGRVEILRLPYGVDTRPPLVHLDVSRKGNRYRFHAIQLRADDATRVEVRAPDGQVVSLTHVRIDDFVGTWTPRVTPSSGATLHVVAVDRALNESQSDTVLP